MIMRLYARTHALARPRSYKDTSESPSESRTAAHVDWWAGACCGTP
jgi:hypothetical protein